MSEIKNDANHEHPIFKPKPYWNPYIAGIGLGLVLLAAFVIMGRGLGASGAFSSAAAPFTDSQSAAKIGHRPNPHSRDQAVPCLISLNILNKRICLR